MREYSSISIAFLKIFPEYSRSDRSAFLLAVDKLSVPFEGLGVCADNDSQRSYTRHFRSLDPFAEESKPAVRRVKKCEMAQTLPSRTGSSCLSQTPLLPKDAGRCSGLHC